MTIFNFAIGNGDTHRRNFSLLTSEEGPVVLSPVYDLVSSRRVLPSEREEMALSLGGRRNRLERADFLSFAEREGIAASYAESRVVELLMLRDELLEMVHDSVLTREARAGLSRILAERLDRLN